MSEIVNEVVAEVKKVEGEVVAEAKAVVDKVEAVAERITQELSTEERLAIREIENTYLKAQMEINRLSQITQNAQKEFTAKVEELTKKYVVDPATWMFDNVALIFKRKQ